MKQHEAVDQQIGMLAERHRRPPFLPPRWPAPKQLPPDAADFTGPKPGNPQSSGGNPTGEPPISGLRIRDIQGRQHLSPYRGSFALDVPGDGNYSASYNETVEPSLRELRDIYGAFGAKDRVQLVVTPGKGLAYQRRAATGGATTVPAHMFYEIVRKLPEGAEVMLKTDEDGNAMSVISGRSSFRRRSRRCPAGPVRGYRRRW